MENLNKFIEKLDLDKKILLEDIPEIDLYMDQVIQLFDNKFAKSDSDEKILTKTMINNYAKAKLLFPIKNKKYTKKHIILISLIYHLKGALSINDINDTLSGLNRIILEDQDLNLEDFYKSYLEISQINTENFKKDLKSRADDVASQLNEFNDNDLEYLERVLLISSFVYISNLYKNAAEKLVAEVVEDYKEIIKTNR